MERVGVIIRNKITKNILAKAAVGSIKTPARARTEEALWTARAVEDHFREAILTLKKLPPVELKGYFNAWPDIVYTPNEKIFQEKKPLRILATPEAISKLDKTFEWMTWISIEERKLIWKRAARVRWKTICRELECDRTTAWRKWHIACSKIAACLNAREILGNRNITKQ